MDNKKPKNTDIQDAEIIENSNESKSNESSNDYSPFDEPIKQRNYTKPNINPDELQQELEVPEFTSPDLSEFELEEDPTQEESSEAIPPSSDAPPKGSQERPPFNESYNELSNAEKNKGAEVMFEAIMDGYSKLKYGMGYLVRINENKLEQEFADGTINPNLRIPVDEHGTTLGVKEFATEFNDSTKEAFETSDEFKEKIKPPLTRVLKKRGIGMTDEQICGYYILTDLGTAGFQAVALSKTAKMMLHQLREQTDYMKGQNQQPPPTRTQPQQQSAPEKPYTEPEEEEKVFEVKAQPKTNPQNPSGDSNFATEMETPENMPNFGDPKILAELDAIEKQSTHRPKTKKPVKRGRPRKKN